MRVYIAHATTTGGWRFTEHLFSSSAPKGARRRAAGHGENLELVWSTRGARKKGVSLSLIDFYGSFLPPSTFRVPRISGSSMRELGFSLPFQRDKAGEAAFIFQRDRSGLRVLPSEPMILVTRLSVFQISDATAEGLRRATLPGGFRRSGR